MSNIYFELTRAFNAGGHNVVLASGQAVVFYRIAIMSKAGDWVIRETPEACGRVLLELDRRGARYRIAAPLDVRWLSGGWSSHFEFEERRVARYEEASREYFALCRQEGLTRRPLPEAHRLACQLAERSLPQSLGIVR